MPLGDFCDSTYSEDGYEVCVINDGSEAIYDISVGETLENWLIEVGDRASFSLRAPTEGDYTVRNIGFDLGETDRDRASYVFQGARGDGLIENVYMNGKGATDSESTHQGGFWSGTSHEGDLTVRNCYIEGMADNAMYMSGQSSDSGSAGEGTVTIRNCFTKDCTAGMYRAGVEGSSVKNSVAVLDDEDGIRRSYKGEYSSSDTKLGRPIWGRDAGVLEVEDCTFYVNENDVGAGQAIYGGFYHPDCSSNYSTPYTDFMEVNVDDFHTNQDPVGTATTGCSNDPHPPADINIGSYDDDVTVSVIEDGGVPTSPEMAARGEREMPVDEVPWDEDVDPSFDDEIVLEEGEKVVQELEDGDVFEDVWIDQTAEGASYTISAAHVDFEIRNVGFHGVGEPDGDDPNTWRHIQVAGDGVIENVYMSNIPTSDDDVDLDGNESMGGIYVGRAHDGHVDIRNVYVEGMGRPGIDAAEPGHLDGGDGSVHIENCYGVNNNVAQFTVGQNNSRVIDCVGVIDDIERTRAPDPDGDWETCLVQGRYQTSTSVEGGSYWIGDYVDEEDVVALWRATGSDAQLVVAEVDRSFPDHVDEELEEDGGTVSVFDVGDDPDRTVLDDGVPLSAEMARDGNQTMPSIPDSRFTWFDINLWDDWRTRWDSESDDWRTGSDSGWTGNSYVEFVGEESGYHAIMDREFGFSDDADVYAEVQVDESAPGQAHLYVRGSGIDGGDSDAYFVGYNGDEWAIMRLRDGFYGTLDTADSPVFSTGERYGMRLNVTDETIRARVWHTAVSEPDSWDMVVEDDEHSSGWVGIGSRESVQTRWDVFGAGVEGATAPSEPLEEPGVYTTVDVGSATAETDTFDVHVESEMRGALVRPGSASSDLLTRDVDIFAARRFVHEEAIVTMQDDGLTFTIPDSIAAPQDTGTTYDEDELSGEEMTDIDADWTSAGHISGMFMHPTMDQFARGLEFEEFRWDDGTPQYQLGGGTVYFFYDGLVRVQDENGDYSRDWDSGVAFTCDVPSMVALDEWASAFRDATNYVYVALDRSQNNGLYYVVFEDEEARPEHEPYLYLGKFEENDGSFHWSAVDFGYNRNRAQPEYRRVRSYEGMEMPGYDYIQSPNWTVPDTRIPEGDYISYTIRQPSHSHVFQLWSFEKYVKDHPSSEVRFAVYRSDNEEYSSTSTRDIADPYEPLYEREALATMELRLVNEASGPRVVSASARYSMKEEDAVADSPEEESGVIYEEDDDE